MHRVSGGCHCGNILVELELARAPSAYNPRACDCDFCRKHCAAYVSDAQGSLLIRIKNERASRKYRQGSGQAEWLLCGNCGVLVAVLYRSDGRTYAGVNVKVVGVGTNFGTEVPVSPKKLSASEKAKRWQDIWFSNVSVRSTGLKSGAKTRPQRRLKVRSINPRSQLRET
jgi:hypothetical protein